MQKIVGQQKKSVTESEKEKGKDKDLRFFKRKKQEDKSVNFVKNLKPLVKTDEFQKEKLGVENFVLDSGSPFHFVNNKKFLEDYREQKSTYIASNNLPLEAQGVGHLTLQLENGLVLRLNDVVYSKNVPQNLLSYTHMCEIDKIPLRMKGVDVYIGDGMKKKISFTHLTDQHIHIRAKVLNHFNVVVGNITLSNGDKAMLMHNRLGHPSRKQFELLMRKYPELLTAPSMTMSCIACKVANAVKSTPRVAVDLVEAKAPFKRIHVDICETAITSIGNYKMFLTIVDRYSRYVEIFPLSQKSQAAEQIMVFIQQAHTILPGNPKLEILRSDNGSEFDNEKLRKFCQKRGIKMEFTVPYSSHQNGIAERMHRTLKTKAIALMNHANLPEILWNYAFQMAVMYHNFQVSTVNGYDVPAFKWFSKVLPLPDFKVFGCTVVTAVPPMYRNGISDNGSEGAFLGFPVNRKGWLVFDKGSRLVIISDLVQFLEDRLFFKENKFSSYDIPFKQSLIVKARTNSLKPTLRGSVPDELQRSKKREKD